MQHTIEMTVTVGGQQCYGIKVNGQYFTYGYKSRVTAEKVLQTLLFDGISEMVFRVNFRPDRPAILSNLEL